MDYIEIMRQRLGLDEDDTSKDELIQKMRPFERVKLIIGWKLGDESWGDLFKYWCESQGLEIVEKK